MEIIEETTAFSVYFCHFKTKFKLNQYNLTFTKTDTLNLFEVHLVPLIIMSADGKIAFDRDMRNFVCGKVLDFMSTNKCDVYFNVNCIGLSNEFLVWKFLRWMKSSNYPSNKFDVKITENTINSIRLFEFTIRR